MPAPTLSYAPPPRSARMPWQGMAAIAMVCLVPLTMCVCGHFDWISLTLAAPAMGLAWWGAARTGRGIWRVAMIIVVIASTVMVVKCAADLLWYGHQPLLRPTVAQEMLDTPML